MSVHDMPRLETFGAVAKHYKLVDPVVSTRHKLEDDIRPLGDRRRKWERVKKFSDNCYALYDGEIGDNVQYNDWHGASNLVPDDAHKALAPILWTLQSDGTQILRVRNGSGNGAHTGRYQFLDRALPLGFEIIVDNGKQFVRYNGVKYFLPKSDFQSWSSVRGKDRHNQKDDKKYIEFQRGPDDRHWSIKTNSFVYVPPRNLVDKERKKKFKPAMDSYYSWLLIMAPMFRSQLEHVPFTYDGRSNDRYTENYNLARDKRTELFEYARENKWVSADTQVWNFSFAPEHALEVMEDEEHPMRMHMAWSLLHESCLFDEHESERKKFRSRYNRWINKLCGFNISVDSKVVHKTEVK